MGGDGGGGGHTRELDQTPTWAVAAVCAVIITVSILLESLLHHLGQWFSKRGKKALFDALEKVKSELMTLGFISLLLTIAGKYIASICIPEKAADTMLPCQLRRHSKPADDDGQSHHRRLLWSSNADSTPKRMLLSADPMSSSCSNGTVPFVSANGLHQLHIFIFFLAVFHVAFSAITMALGRAKARKWKEWEQEISSLTNEFSNDSSKFRFTHQTSFVRQHASCWSKSTILLYVVSFFRQFFRSVRKTDYLTLRHGFIAAHLSLGTRFNFRKYIKRSLEDDFKTVVGISPPLWALALAIMLFNVRGWQYMFWFSTTPLIVILAVGTKLQAIIAKMAIEIKERHTVIQGMPVVKLGDEHFWFEKPHLVLGLIHFALFQNAFEITYFFWIWYEFGLRSCFHENFELILARVCLGVIVQFMCSYITLPLYALVSQMGSQMKRTIFDEQTAKALKKWHKAAVNNKQQKEASQDSSETPSANTETSHYGMPVRHLRRYQTIAHTGVATRSMSDTEFSDTDTEMSSQTRTLIPPKKQRSLDYGPTEVHLNVEATPIDHDSFSFPKLTTQNLHDK